MAEEPNRAIQVFYSYAHEDAQWRKRLETHLSNLQRQKAITEWYDQDIGAGKVWASEIDKHLKTAQIILLLISPDFIASDYCYSIEMKQALERHKAGEAYVIPIILRPVDWANTPFSKLSALPEHGKPVTKWRNIDEAFVNVAKGIRKVAEELKITSLSTNSSSLQNVLAEENLKPKKVLNESSDISSKIKPYNFIMLGPSGSGKSIFLASIYSKLAIERREIGFFIEANPTQRKILNEKYFEIVSSENWPSGTLYGEISEWFFKCHIHLHGGSIYSPLNFVYLDYAGGRITDVEDDSLLSAFDLRLKEADALLGMLDGQKLLSLMQKEPGANRFIYIDLKNILDILQGSECIIHFVITKWDLLQRVYSLDQVRDRLLQEEPFDAFVKNGNRRNNVRLIPISSVGMEFAELLSNGSMKKIPGTTLNPFQVELPLVLILIDKFMIEIDSLTKRELQLNSLIRLNAQNRSFDTSEEFRAKQNKSLEAVQKAKIALQITINTLSDLISKFEIAFPASDLTNVK